MKNMYFSVFSDGVYCGGLIVYQHSGIHKFMTIGGQMRSADALKSIYKLGLKRRE